MDKRTELNNALKDAVRGRDAIATGTIRLILAALKERDIMARGQGHAEGVGEAEIMSLLQGMIKQRQESFETYSKAGRKDLADREEAEIEVIRRFLPQQMSEADMRKVVDGLIAELKVADIKDMGKVMGALKARYAGQIDMAKASGLVKERVAG